MAAAWQFGSHGGVAIGELIVRRFCPKGQTVENDFFSLTRNGPNRIPLAMPRKLQLEFPGAMYRIMSRGDQRAPQHDSMWPEMTLALHLAFCRITLSELY